ncbi:Neuronal acetylcholine receptor subunit beta-4 [Bulinus truncatus]|nr:Neuronal acetylcholine receptor subunit beta-4 [Bulinus truncatus]
MDNYPFDQHACSIKMMAMTFTNSEMRFITSATGNVSTNSYTNNGEWDLTTADIHLPKNFTETEFPELHITFHLKRRPFFLLLNVILPAIILSFLNIMVFVIPADSGEKISYGITVLLALSVFLSTVGGMLPRSSNVPMVTVYLFILLIISMLTVINSIIIVYLHHKEEREEQHQKARTYFTRAFNKITQLRQAVTPVTSIAKDTVDQIADVGSDKGVGYKGSRRQKQDGPRVNRYRVIGKHIDLVSFVVFLITWSVVTISVMVKIAA